MSHVSLKFPGTNCGTVTVDGKEVRDVVDVRFTANLDEPMRLDISQNLRGSVDVDAHDVGVTYTRRWLLVWPWLEDIGRDIRYFLRYARKSLDRPL